MITVNFIGGARKSFQTDSLEITQNIDTISEMISHLISKKPENTPDFDGKNLLIAVNGVDSSALAGNNTHLNSGDVVNIIPIIHGGSKTNVTFTIKNNQIQLFEIKKFFLRLSCSILIKKYLPFLSIFFKQILDFWSLIPNEITFKFFLKAIILCNLKNIEFLFDFSAFPEYFVLGRSKLP